MQNRTTFMERLSERLAAVESVLRKLEPVENLLQRLDLLENSIYTTKKVFTFQEACMYIGVSESMLYKNSPQARRFLTTSRGARWSISPRRRLDEWLLQNCEPTIDDANRMAAESAAAEPFFNQRRHGKRKKD